MCNMENDTSTGLPPVIDVIDIESQTQPACEQTNVHVDTLLSCIDLGNNNGEEVAKPTNTNVVNQDRISIKLNNDVKRVNNVVNGLLSMTSLRAAIPENVVVANSDRKNKEMDESTLISKENFPMELSDDDDFFPYFSGYHTSDTRFASGSTDEDYGEFDFPFIVNKDPNDPTLQMIDSQGNSVGSRGPDSEDERLVCERIGISNINMMQLEAADPKIQGPGTPMEVDKDNNIVEKLTLFKEDDNTIILSSYPIPDFEEPEDEDEPKRTYKGTNSRKRPSSGRSCNKKKVKKEKKSRLASGSTEYPIATKGGKLRKGKKCSKPKREASIPSQTKDNGKSLHSVKNVNRNPKAEEVIYNREMEFEKIRGVCYCKSDNSWTAWWTERGKSRKKAFKLSQFGNEGARRMAIEHRMLMEELLPELKEKRTKMNRRKLSMALAKKTNKKAPGTISRNTARPCSNTPAATVASMVEGIYMGTRNKSKVKRAKQGEVIANDTFQSNLNPTIDSNLPAPHVNQVPFSVSIQNTGDTHSDNRDTIVNTNEDANLAPTNCKRQNETTDTGEIIFLQYKRRRDNTYKPMIRRIEEIERFRNLEINLEEEMKRRNMATNQGVPSEAVVQPVHQISEEVNVLSDGSEQSSTESDATQNTEPPKISDETPISCQVKVDRKTHENLQKAIRTALANLPGNNTANEEDNNTSPEDTSTPQDAQNPQSPDEDEDYVNVSALCIPNPSGDNQTLRTVVPTSVTGPDGKTIITYLFLNS